MKIKPVACESLGIRSMATYVETPDVKIFIDPGASVSPDRYALPPHKIEMDRFYKIWESVKQWVQASDIIIITHFHNDHHHSETPEMYRQKDLLIKDPRAFINETQRTRAEYFLNRVEGIPKTVQVCDGTTLNLGKTRIVFSPPMTHGVSNRLGYVVQVLVDEDQRFIFTSDVQGPVTDEATDFIIANQPDILMVDGPATYLLGTHCRKADVECSVANLKKIVDKTPVKNLIIDHHLLRDLDWFSYVQDLGKIRSGVIVQSAAAFAGEKEDLLEAKRKDFYEGKSPNVDNYG